MIWGGTGNGPVQRGVAHFAVRCPSSGRHDASPHQFPEQQKEPYGFHVREYVLHKTQSGEALVDEPPGLLAIRSQKRRSRKFETFVMANNGLPSRKPYLTYGSKPDCQFRILTNCTIPTLRMSKHDIRIRTDSKLSLLASDILIGTAAVNL